MIVECFPFPHQSFCPASPRLPGNISRLILAKTCYTLDHSSPYLCFRYTSRRDFHIQQYVIEDLERSWDVFRTP